MNLQEARKRKVTAKCSQSLMAGQHVKIGLHKLVICEYHTVVTCCRYNSCCWPYIRCQV